MFGKKKKDNINDFLKALYVATKNKLEIRYFDNSNLTPVQSGKIPLQQGWYVSQHKQHFSQVKLDVPFYENFAEALMSIKNMKVDE